MIALDEIVRFGRNWSSLRVGFGNHQGFKMFIEGLIGMLVLAALLFLAVGAVAYLLFGNQQ